MKGPMSAEAYYATLLRALKGRTDIRLTWHTLRYGKHGHVRYRFLRIASRDIARDDKILLITTGMHGDEAAGPLFVLRRINWILDTAHRAGVKVIIYPLMNPSGFEFRTKYNLLGDARLDRGNNDFLVYRKRNGELVYDLGSRKNAERSFWSSDKRLHLRLPTETKLMHRLLKNDFWSFPGQIAGALDLHEGQDDDDFTLKVPPGAFCYAFAKHPFRDIFRQVERSGIRVLRNRRVSDGFERMSDGLTLTHVMKTDDDGRIRDYDGSLTDLLRRLDVCAACVDTTTGLPRRTIMKLYAICINEMIAYVKSRN